MGSRGIDECTDIFAGVHFVAKIGQRALRNGKERRYALAKTRAAVTPMNPKKGADVGQFSTEERSIDMVELSSGSDEGFRRFVLRPVFIIDIEFRFRISTSLKGQRCAQLKAGPANIGRKTSQCRRGLFLGSEHGVRAGQVRAI